MHIAPNDILKRKTEIKDFVAAGNIEKAIKRFIDFMRDFCEEHENEVIMLSMRYSSLKRDVNLGIIKDDDVRIEESKIAFSLLNSLDELSHKFEMTLAEVIGQQEMPNEIVLKISNIIKEYKSTAFKLEVDDLELRQGEITGLIGENATGKSTLLKILAGDLAPDSGQLHYPLFQKGESINWLRLKRQIAYVPQELPAWTGSLSDNLHYEAALHGIRGAANKKAVKFILERMGLSEHIDKSWRQLSGGYKLRFALAKALVWDSNMLIIDEPLAFLDIKAQLIVLDDLKNLAKSLQHPISIILSSQHLHEIESVSDQLLFMRGGKMENLGNPKNFNRKRSTNHFEISCSLSYSEFIEQLEGYDHEHVQFNGMSYIITSPITSSGVDLLNHLSKKKVEFQYFRDISQSSKTKFYENNF